MRVRQPGRARRHAGARPPQTASGPSSNEIAPKATPRLHTGTCPVCSGEGKLKVERRRGGAGWSVFCRRVECDGLTPGEWLREVAAIVNAPGGGDILSVPLFWLADYLEDSRPVTLADAPTSAHVEGYASRLWTEPEPLAYLTDERGLSERTLRRARVGWDTDRSAIVFPAFNAAGEVANLVRRPLTHVTGPKYVTTPGRTKDNGGVELYPRPLPDEAWLLVEGVIDALLLRQEGMPEAVSGTHGVSTFLDAWLPLVKGRKVAVAFDVGVEQEQGNCVRKLREAKANAWGVELSRLGLPDKGDLSDYLRNGGTTAELRRFINSAYRRSRS